MEPQAAVKAEDSTNPAWIIPALQMLPSYSGISICSKALDFHNTGEGDKKNLSEEILSKPSKKRGKETGGLLISMVLRKLICGRGVGKACLE